MSSKQIFFTNPLVFNANPAWQLSLISAQLTLTLAGAAYPVPSFLFSLTDLWQQKVLIKLQELSFDNRKVDNSLFYKQN